MGCRTTATSPEQLEKYARLNTYQVAAVRLLPGEAALDPGWRRQSARPQPHSVWRCDEQSERAPARQPAARGRGRRSGRLKGGRHLAFPPVDNVPMTNLLVSLLDKGGVRSTSWATAPDGSTSIRCRGSSDRAVGAASCVAGRRGARGARHAAPAASRRWSRRSRRGDVKRRADAAGAARRPQRQPEIDGTTALHWAAHLDNLDAAASYQGRRQGAGREPLRRDAAHAGVHQRQRADGRAPARTPARIRTPRCLKAIPC